MNMLARLENDDMLAPADFATKTTEMTTCVTPVLGFPKRNDQTNPKLGGHSRKPFVTCLSRISVGLVSISVGLASD